jgi:hypothetical protein
MSGMRPTPGAVVAFAGARRRAGAGSLRIVSLVPSLTELLCALDLREALVGRTGFCIHPRELLRDVPKVGGTKDVKVERVRELAPTHVVVNVDENEKGTVDALAEFVPEIVVTHPVRVEDNLALIDRFGMLFDRRERAAVLIDRFVSALAVLRARRFEPLRTVYLIWKDPWMTVGPDTFIARMLAEAGMIAVSPASDTDDGPASGAARYPVVDLDWLRDCGAELVLLSSEPYRFREAHADALAATLSGGTGRAGGPAAPECMTIDGEMTSWYGSRAAEGLAYLVGFREQVDARRASRPARPAPGPGTSAHEQGKIE